MCGLFGWDLRETPDPLLVRALALFSDTRGGDSWGFYCPENELLMKGLDEITRDEALDEMVGKKRLMGHTRNATHGAVSTRNAHPFRLKYIVGAHNGIVHNHEELNWMYERRCQVDSKHIFIHLQKGLPLDDIEAYGAVEYVWRGLPEIWLGKFNQGELSIASVPNGLVWASDREHLRLSLKLARISYELYHVKESVLYYTVDGELWDSKELLTIDKPRYKLEWETYRSIK